MKPQKKSIKDFFSPVSRSPQPSQGGTPQLQDAKTARASPLDRPRDFSPLHSSAPLTTSTPLVLATSSAHSTSHAPNTVKATSPDVQLPIASQNSANSGASKRIIVSNGEQVVLNSDSDSDSLPELDWGIPTTSLKAATSTTRSKRTAEHDDDGLRRPDRRPKNKKRPFDHVVETVQEHRETERLIVEHKAVLENVEQEAPEYVFNEDKLSQAVQDDDDPGKAHRLFLAMQRTNAMQVESVYHFFHDASDSIAVQSKLPTQYLPDQRWTLSFREATARDQAFMTGFAHQIFRMQELPEELASWMLDQICRGESEALHSKYLEILEGHSHHLRALLDRNRLDVIFKSMGADVKSLNSDSEIHPSAYGHTARVIALPRTIRSTIRLLGKAAPWLRTKARSHALLILCHVILDERVASTPCVLTAVQDTVEAIICNFVDNQKLVQGLSNVVPRLLSRITHPLLQKNLICALPSISPVTAYLKRYLAISFIVYPITVDVSLGDHQVPALLHRHLEESPNFRIDKKTDYGCLAARLTLIDVAIGPGFLTVPFKPLIDLSTSQAVGDTPSIMAPFPSSSEVKDFNKEVDMLVLHIKLLGNNIVEKGAVVDLTILDAKDCVERLCARLEHAVRIGGKKAHNVFGNDEEEKQLKVSDIFRKAAAKSRNPVPTGGIFDNDEDDNVDEAITAQIETEVAF